MDDRYYCNIWFIRHLIPLLMKEGRVSLAGFCTALVSSSMEHPGHVVLAQNLKQEGEPIVCLFLHIHIVSWIIWSEECLYWMYPLLMLWMPFGSNQEVCVIAVIFPSEMLASSFLLCYSHYRIGNIPIPCSKHHAKVRVGRFCSFSSISRVFESCQYWVSQGAYLASPIVSSDVL